MNNLLFSILIYFSSVAAGLVGALTGLGGGVIIIPLLTIFFGVDIRYAAGASLISVIATSSGAASAYVKEGFSNIRIGMFLEIATTLGAIIGATLVVFVSPGAISIIFGLVLIYSAFQSYLSSRAVEHIYKSDKIATKLKLNGEYPSMSGIKNYFPQKVPIGFGIMFLAGSLSGLLGIGSGAVKVLAMDQFMKIPFKVSTTTSNFMIGVTAVASAGIYFSHGFINPSLAMPVMLGVLTGAFAGAKILTKTPSKKLKIIFSIIIIILAVEMLRNGLK